MKARPLAKQGPLRVLVIGDAHVRKRSSLRGRSRWRAAARFACRQRPDVIVFIGDLWDMESLDRDSKARNGAGRSARLPDVTVSQDIDAGKAAIQSFEDEIARYNARASRSGKKDLVYKPRRAFCLGNHEMRINDAGAKQEHMVDWYDVKARIGDWLVERGYEVIPFLDVLEINEVFFSHFFESGVMGKAVPITQAMQKIGRSAVWGHTHTMGYFERQIPKKIKAAGWDKWLCLPTFKDPAFLAHGETSGLVLLDDVWGGSFVFSVISTDRLLADYDSAHHQAPPD